MRLFGAQQRLPQSSTACINQASLICPQTTSFAARVISSHSSFSPVACCLLLPFILFRRFHKGWSRTFFRVETPFSIKERIEGDGAADLREVLPRWKPCERPELKAVTVYILHPTNFACIRLTCRSGSPSARASAAALRSSA